MKVSQLLKVSGFAIVTFVAAPVHAGIVQCQGDFNPMPCMLTCPPEMEAQQLRTADKVLLEVAARPEFATETKFQAIVTDITLLQDLESRHNKYLDLLGIKPTLADMQQFVSSRDMSKYIDMVQIKTGLSRENATTLTNVIKAELLNAING